MNPRVLCPQTCHPYLCCVPRRVILTCVVSPDVSSLHVLCLQTCHPYMCCVPRRVILTCVVSPDVSSLHVLCPQTCHPYLCCVPRRVILTCVVSPDVSSLPVLCPQTCHPYLCCVPRRVILTCVVSPDVTLVNSCDLAACPISSPHAPAHHINNSSAVTASSIGGKHKSSFRYVLLKLAIKNSQYLVLYVSLLELRQIASILKYRGTTRYRYRTFKVSKYRLTTGRFISNVIPGYRG